jgi:predicted nuclease with RNAse H fold
MRPRLRRPVEVGMVGVNVPIPVPVAYHLRRLEALALRRSFDLRPEGVRFYTRLKTITPLARRHQGRRGLHLPED